MKNINAVLSALLAGTALAAADTLIRTHTHTHRHTFAHTHGGSTHTHTVTHAHPHNHYITDGRHGHRHTQAELKRAPGAEHI
ncbi:MAG: hypothetical protein HFF25_09565 [Oscillospiraceae bacterium]|nr:hypothetical protein [Oscillospiraceae bacterium]